MNDSALSNMPVLCKLQKPASGYKNALKRAAASTGVSTGPALATHLRDI